MWPQDALTVLLLMALGLWARIERTRKREGPG